jgi:hypothetical protein
MDRSRYPDNWSDITAAIRERAGDRCECTGQCATRGAKGPACLLIIGQGDRCEARNRSTSWRTGARIVLTVAHLDDNTEHNQPDNLLAMCQACHLAYDTELHRKNRAANLAARQPDLFDGNPT